MNIIINVFASSSPNSIKLAELLLQKCKDSLYQYILSLLEEKHENPINVEINSIHSEALEYEFHKAVLYSDVVIFDGSLEEDGISLGENYACIPHAPYLMDNVIVVSRTELQINFIPNAYQTNVVPIGEETKEISRFIKSIICFHEYKPHDNIYSSIFAPAEVKRKSHMLVQVYLHLYKETEKVKTLAQESDRKAERRDYIPLQCKLKKGDKVEVLLNIYGEMLLMSDKKNVVWHGSFTKCSFDYFIPKNIDVDELSCVALLSVNGVPVGEMRFITKIVDSPRQLNPEIIAHKYNKVFISYSHHDESKVKFLHQGLELANVPHFFDRKYLGIGDVFPKVIQDYINSADLFILCWSENASNSEYVQKERMQALERAYPQVQPEQAAKLRIYPISIEPRAELPREMKNYYHFGTL